MKPEQCFRCLRTFSELNPANPKLATSLLTCIKCGQINLGKSGLELHYKIHHSSPAPHTLCDGCASSLGRTTERVYRTDNLDAVKDSNRRVQSSPSGCASMTKVKAAHDPSKKYLARSSSRRMKNTRRPGTRSARRSGKDRASRLSRTEDPFGETSKKKFRRFLNFFK